MPSLHSSPLESVEIKTPLQEAEARAKLSQVLSVSLDVGEVIGNFFRHIQPLLRVDGLRYISTDQKIEHHEGKTCTHHCNYRLTSDDNYLGEIIFGRRRKRFSEGDMLAMEALLGLLIYPLRNALNYQRAVAQAMRDSLTGVGNRAALDQAMHRELQLSERHQHPFSVLIIDIDHFKRINDEHGHTRGDMVLQEIASTIQQVCRTTDMVFRFGGEEFVVMLDKTDQMGAHIIAERLRKTIARQAFILGDNKVQMTVSIGVGTHQTNQKEHVDSLFERADRALYRAKAKGRNCVVNALENISSAAC